MDIYGTAAMIHLDCQVEKIELYIIAAAVHDSHSTTLRKMYYAKGQMST